MAQLWQVTKQMIDWLMNWHSMDEQQYDCNCLDEDDIEFQESSGIGTVMVIIAIIAGLVLTISLIPGEQRQSILFEREQRLRQLIKRLRNRNALADNWQDAVLLTDEDETQRLLIHQRCCKHATQLCSKVLQSIQEDYYDVPTDHSEEAPFVDARDDNE